MDTSLHSTHVELFAVQPRVSLEDYASEEAFAERHHALARRIDELRTRDSAGQPLYPALAVWPEMVGAPLGVMGHFRRVHRSRTTQAAMFRVALAEAVALASAALRHRPHSLEECLYVATAAKVHRAMWRTFSGIAKDFGLWVVGGSALVPRNRLGADTPDFAPVSARTYNTSYTFSPEGRCVTVTRKVNLVPTQEDVVRLSPGSPEELVVVPTPFGRLGTLICYDGFREPHTSAAREPNFIPAARVLDALGADIIAQPSANAWPWDGPWAFNDPGENQLRREQWFNEGLYSQLGTLSRVRYAVNPQLIGRFFENVFEAPSLILERSATDGVRILAQSTTPRDEDILHVTVPIMGTAEPAPPLSPRASSSAGH